MRKRIVALDRKLGRAWSRLGGAIFLVIGVVGVVIVTFSGRAEARI